MEFPILGGGLASAFGEKLSITRQALLSRQVRPTDVAREFFITAPKQIVSEFKQQSPSELAATTLFIGTAPFLGGGPIRQFVSRRASRAKAVKDLSPSKLAQLERFELSVAELKGVRPVPKKLNLAEVERLTPKAAKSIDKVLLENRREIVVGGSVAQRTQIQGKSRIPEDLDVFTSGNTGALLRDIKAGLDSAGVPRVSIVRSKQITIGGKKAIEVKRLQLLEANIKKVQLPFQLVSSAFVNTPRGVRVLRLGAQAQRKLVGGFGLERERIRRKAVVL